MHLKTSFSVWFSLDLEDLARFPCSRVSKVPPVTLSPLFSFSFFFLLLDRACFFPVSLIRSNSVVLLFFHFISVSVSVSASTNPPPRKRREETVQAILDPPALMGGFNSVKLQWRSGKWRGGGHLHCYIISFTPFLS